MKISAPRLPRPSRLRPSRAFSVAAAQRPSLSTLTGPAPRMRLRNPWCMVLQPLRCYAVEHVSPPKDSLSTAQYHKIADHTLEDYQEEFSKLQDSLPDFDMEYSSGVLTLKLGSKGTYVINKQTPNQQMWLSSPVSGPKRYNYSAVDQCWRNTRDGHLLSDLLSRELTQASGIAIALKDRPRS